MENTTDVADDVDALFKHFMPPQWSLNAELVIMIVVFVLGVPGNALIITVQYRTRNKTSTDYLVMVMAMYEFLGSLVNTMFKMIRDIVPLWHLISSSFVCKATPSLYFFAQYGSGLTLCALAIDRLIKTMFPLSRWYGELQAKIMCAFILVHVFAQSVPHVFLEDWDPVSLQCALLYSSMYVLVALNTYGSIMMFTIFFIMSGSYLSIVVFLKRRHMTKVKKLKYTQKFQPGEKPESSCTDSSCAASDSVTIVTDTTVCAMEISTVGGDLQPPQIELSQPSKAATIEKPGNAGTNVKRNMLTLEGRNVNKLTVLMFMISVIYVASYIPLWYLYITGALEFGVGVLQLSFSIPMLNCISNPVMYFTMSSRFRQNVKVLLFSPKRRA